MKDFEEGEEVVLKGGSIKELINFCYKTIKTTHNTYTNLYTKEMEDNFGKCNSDGGYYIQTSELRRAEEYEILLYNFYKRPYNIDIFLINTRIKRYYF